MYFWDIRLSGKLRILTALIALISIAGIAGAFSATADDQFPQTSQVIDLNGIPNPAALTIFGATAGDHLSGNGAANTFTTFPRAHALVTGDFNGDGTQDVAIGAPDTDFTPAAPATPRTNAGAVYILFGRPTFPSPTTIDTNLAAVSQPDIKIFGGATDDNVGFALAAGDLNGDGTADLAIGAPGFDALRGTPATANPDTGAVFILFGGTTLTARTIDLSSANPVNIVILGEVAGDRFGGALAVADVNGATPARNDLLVGAPASKGPTPVATPRTDGGAAYLLAGGPTLENAAATIKTVDLADTAAPVKVFGRAGSQLGSSVAIGDINSEDGADIIVGAPKANRPETGGDVVETGAVYVVFGGANLNPVAPATTKTFDITATGQSISIYGATANDHLGASVAAGNIRGGVTTDLIIGAPEGDGAGNGRTDSGEVYILGGGAGLDTTAEKRIDIASDPAVNLTVFGATAGNHLGSFVTVGRINSAGNTDTVNDVLIGAPGFSTNRGGVFVLYGGPNLFLFTFRDLVLGQDDLRVVGQAEGDELGWAIATGDIDNNRGGDLLAGAPFADPGFGPGTARADAGKVYGVLATADVIPPVNQNPTVSLTAPNGGETIQGGSTFQIQWTASDPDGDATLQRFELRLSTDGGVNFNTIIPATLDGNARSFNWNVPALNTTQARVRVIAFDNAGGQAQDDSNANFTISDVGVVLSVTAPNGGEVLRFGQTFTIMWTVDAAFATQVKGFDIFLVNDDTMTTTNITAPSPLDPALPAAARQFAWTVPSTCIQAARVIVRATSVTNVVSSDISNNPFTIADLGPQFDPNKISLNSDGTKLNLKIVSGSTPRIVSGVKVEISNEAGTTFFQVADAKRKGSGKKIQTKGLVNGQTVGAFWPDGQIRIVRITNPVCGLTTLRLRRTGNLLVPAPPFDGEASQ
jgi:hypothetical protein